MGPCRVRLQGTLQAREQLQVRYFNHKTYYMKKLLLLMVAVCFCVLGSLAESTTVSFASFPTGWNKSGTVASQTRENESCHQLQKSATITSPEYKNLTSITLRLNISSGASTLTVGYSTDNGATFKTLRTINNSECNTKAWKDFPIDMSNIDSSNGVKIKLTSAANSYYISKFTYETTGDPSDTRSDVALSWGDVKKYNVTIGESFTAPELTVNPADAKSAVRYTLTNERSQASIDETTGIVTIGDTPGVATVKAYIPEDNDTYKPTSAEYQISIRKPIPANAIYIDFLANVSDNNGVEIKSETTAGAIFEETSLEYLATNAFSSYATAYYKSANGLKLGSGNNFGKITLNLAKKYYITSIIAAVSPWTTEKTSSLTINDVNQTFSTASDNLEYVYTDPKITDQVTIETVTATGADKRAYVKSLIIIYDEVETVATPTFTPYGGEVEADSDITINCATEGATLHYAWNNEDAAELFGNLVPAQQGTLSVYATKEGMQQSETASATFTIKTPSGVAPSVPVVTTADGNEIGNHGEVTLPYGTHITVTSTGANMLSVEINDIKTTSESDTYEFILTEDVICQFYGSNYFGFSDYITFTAQVAKADLVVKFDGTEVLDGQTYTVRPGTVVTLTTTTGTTLGIYDEELNEVVSEECKYLEYTINEDCNLTFEASTPATGTSTILFDVTFVVDATEPPAPDYPTGPYTKVTSTDDLNDFDYYIIVCEDAKVAMANAKVDNDKNWIDNSPAKIENNTIDEISLSTMVFKLEKGTETNSWAFNGLNPAQEKANYLSVNPESGDKKSKTYIWLFDSPAYMPVAFNAQTGNLEITDINNRTLNYETQTSSNRFGTYGTTTAKPVQLYCYVAAIPAPVEAHSDTHFVISATQGTLYVKEYDGLKPDINPSPKAVHTPEEGFVAAEGNTWSKEKTAVTKDTTVDAYIEHNGRVSKMLSINLHPDGSTTTGIENVTAGNNAEAVLYNLQGLRVDAATAAPGIYVRVAGTTVSKVVVR